MQNRDVRLAAVLYAQVGGFDRLFEEDAEAGLALLDRLTEQFTRLCPEYRGRIIRSVRDSFLVEFPTALDAVQCSLAIQEAVVSGDSEAVARGYGLTMGVHLGDIHFLENDAAGEAISIATKLQTMATPGSVAVSQEVHNSISGRLSVGFRSVGSVDLEGRAGSIQVYVSGGSSTTSGRTATTGGSRPSGTTNAQDFDELKGFVLEQIKRVGRRISTDRVREMLQSRSPELDEAIEKLADMGFLSRPGSMPRPAAGHPHVHRPPDPPIRFDRFDRDAWRETRHAIREAVRESRHEYRHGHRHHDDEDEEGFEEGLESLSGGYAGYRERVIRRADKAVGGLAGHLVPFVVVNGGLFFLNLTTGFGFPWFLFPLGGWAIGIISHIVSVGTHRKEKKEVEALPDDLDDEDYKLVKRFHHARASVRSTIGSTTAVGAFLLMINLIVSPGFIWAAFPIAGLLIAVISSLGSYAARRGTFRKRLKELFARKKSGLGASASTSTTASAQDPPVVVEAARIAATIIDQSKRLDPTKAYLGEDLEPLLGNYISQIRTLSRRGTEVDEIMAAIPRAELKKDLAALRSNLERATEPSLKREYQKSIEQIERQNRSFDELENQKELLDLRISGSLNSLKQMQIDLARMTGLSAEKEIDSIDRLRSKSRELTEYLSDFNEGYQEIEGLPESGEEQRKRADQLLKEFKEREGSGPNA